MIETRPTGSGFNSFLRWFKKNEKIREENQKTNELNKINENNEINFNQLNCTDSNANNNNNNNIDFEFDPSTKLKIIENSTDSPVKSIKNRKKYESNETLSTPSSPNLDRKSIASSSDSVFSTATLGFAFISPLNYKPYGDASQPEKLISPGPITETYRKRIIDQEKIRETDKKLELTLRRKYKLFQGNENRLLLEKQKQALDNTEQLKYSEYSLPNVNKKYTLDSEEEDGIYDNIENTNNCCENKKKHRRTCSDSSKDKKAGAYVHVKGKRKAPQPPPTPTQSSNTSLNSNNNNNTLKKISTTTTPVSTIGRNKKRKAPKPPGQIINDSPPESILTEGLLEDKEIRAFFNLNSQMEVITQESSKKVSNESIEKDLDNQQFIFDIKSEIQPDNILSNNSIFPKEKVLSNDTLKIEKGILKSNKELPSNIEIPIIQLKKEDNPPISPISPRPWYKRPLSGTRDTSIPFKKEIILKTVDKRKNKKDKHDDLPEFSFCRNSIFESAAKFGFFRSSQPSSSTGTGSLNSNNSDDSKNKKSDLQEKRKSGIGIPSISELDREAAEIVSKEQASEKARIELENEKYYQPPSEFALESKMLSTVVDDSNEDRKSAKELISKFEANSNHQKITINTAYIGRNDLFENKSKINQPITEQLTKSINNPPEEKKTEKKLDILGVWTCPFCTLQNPNWRIICEVCEKIKPYDLRIKNTNNENIETIPSQNDLIKSTDPPKNTKTVTTITSIPFISKFSTSQVNPNPPVQSEWDKKTEKVRKYFNLPSRFSSGNTLSKSSSETSIGGGVKTKYHKNDQKFGSPKFGLRNSKDKYDSIRTQTSLDESKIGHLKPLAEKNEEQFQLLNDNVLTTTVPIVCEPPSVVVVKNELTKKYDTVKEEKKPVELLIKERPKTEFVEKTSPDLEILRNARISRFEQSDAKTLHERNEKIERLSSSHDELEKEKERLREMIRQMNARALAEKYPVIQSSNTKNVNESVTVPESNIKEEDSEIESTPTVVGVIPKTPQQTSNDATKLGAIKKLFARKEPSIPVKHTKPTINSDDSVLLPYLSKQKSYENLKVATDPLKNDKNYENCPIYENLKDPILQNFKFTPQETEKVNEITNLLQSQKGVDDFKATLRSSQKTINSTNTLAINKILRNLENAIADGEYELAASLAKKLAQMKVTLSVTRQKDRPPSGTDFIYDEIIEVQLYIEDKKSRRGPFKLNISPSLKVFDLKQQLDTSYDLPNNIKCWYLNGEKLDNPDLRISHYGIIKNEDVLNITFEFENNLNMNINKIEKEKKNKTNNLGNSIVQNDLNSVTKNLKKNLSVSEDDEELNERIDLNIEDFVPNEVAGAVGVTQLSKNKKEDDTNKGWSCPLCTLINKPNRSNCAACSESRPSNYILPKGFTNDNVNHITNDLKTFLESESTKSDGNKNKMIGLNNLTEKNDLNKTQNQNRKSTEVMNIQFDERFDSKIKQTSKIPIKTLIEPSANDLIKRPTNTSIVMTVLNNPNISKNKYRGVNNYNPRYSPFTSSNESITLIQPGPELKSIIKSTKKNAAPQPPQRANHYLELLNLDQTDFVSNFEPFECKICFVEYGKGEGVILRECLHIFCRTCLANTIQYSDEVEIKCPYMDDQYSCDSMIQEREIKALVTREVYEQHLAKSIRQAENRIENAFHCKTPSCRGWCIYEDNVNTFKCPVCQITNCLTCQAIHDGLNCKQYQDRLNSGCDTNLDANRTKEMLQEMVDKGEAMKCPTCQVILMKKWGCDWLKCSMCKTEICWVTRGPRWGPGGKGDTTGGCKCGVNGKKCHSQCNYCH